MTQPTLPLDIPWLNDTERQEATQLLNGLLTLCQDRGHTPDLLTGERIRNIVRTGAMANRLEAHLAELLQIPKQRIPGAQANAATLARHRYARALDEFDSAYPQPAPEPKKELPPGMATSLGMLCTDVYRERVNEVMERMAPELDPDEDPVVTTYFMALDSGRKFHYELPKEAYTNIIRKPQIGDPVHPITREPMIPMDYRERQAKWDEIRRLKAEAEAKANQTPQPQPETPDPPNPSHSSHSSHVSRRLVAPKPREGGSPAKADPAGSALGRDPSALRVSSAALPTRAPCGQSDVLPRHQPETHRHGDAERRADPRRFELRRP